MADDGEPVAAAFGATPRPQLKRRRTDDASPFSAATQQRAREVPGRQQETQWRRRELGIAVDGGDAETLPLVERFEELALPAHIMEVLNTRSITHPTPIQMQAIPSILSGRDVVGLAATGSGKTLAYLLPWLATMTSPPPRGLHTDRESDVTPSALIVVPTRELMDQVFHDLRSFCDEQAATSQASRHGEPMFVAVGIHFTVGAVCGGVSLGVQIQQLRSARRAGVHVLVATPGRLLHLMDQRIVSLRAVTYVVLDEVDRMIDAEMEPQLRLILQAANEVSRQTLLWSATMPHFLERLARSAVLNPITIRLGMGSQRSGRTSLQVTQDVQFLRFAEKKHRLLHVLRRIPTPPVLVFCNSHESVDFVVRVLRSEQFHAAGLHGEKSQAYRFQVMAAFREGYVDVLVATDLASRGINFTEVDHVVVFDMPHTIEDYVHRCGRTGRRAGNGGKVTAFLTEDCTVANELRQLLKETKQRLPHELETLSRFQKK